MRGEVLARPVTFVYRKPSQLWLTPRVCLHYAPLRAKRIQRRIFRRELAEKSKFMWPEG